MSKDCPGGNLDELIRIVYNLVQFFLENAVFMHPSRLSV